MCRSVLCVLCVDVVGFWMLLQVDWCVVGGADVVWVCFGVYCGDSVVLFWCEYCGAGEVNEACGCV